MEEVDKWRTIESLIAGLSEIAREIKEIEAETDSDEHTSDEKCKEAGLPPTTPEAHYNAVMNAREQAKNPVKLQERAAAATEAMERAKQDRERALQNQAKYQQELETYGNNEWLDANPDAANEYISNWGINKGINKSGYKYNPNAQTDEELIANRQYDAWVEQELKKESSKFKRDKLRKQYYMSPEERNAALLEDLKKRNAARAEAAAKRANGSTSDETCKTSYVGLLGPRKEKH